MVKAVMMVEVVLCGGDGRREVVWRALKCL